MNEQPAACRRAGGVIASNDQAAQRRPYARQFCRSIKEVKMMTDRRAFGFSLAAAATAVAGATPAQAADDVREANKRTVLAFYDAALNRSNIEEAAAYFGPHFIQHNPRSKDGIEGFRSLLQDVKKQFPGLRSDVKRVFADGDFVILHVHVKLQPEELGLAIVEIFRLEHGKIVEHWDVRQPIPETAANTNGMF
jgi:predicted SnoaL-like aldol condensation-catalyzing enzyme